MDARGDPAADETVEDDFALTLHGYAALRRQGNGLSPRLGRNGPSPRKGKSPSASASAAVRFWNDVLESQKEEASEGESSMKKNVAEESPAGRPSLQPLLELLDDVHFSESEEMLEDEYLVVQPYELDSAEEMEIAPGKDDVQMEVEDEFTYGDVSDEGVLRVCLKDTCWWGLFVIVL